MRICIDIQAAIGQQAGVGRYARCLAEELARGHRGHELGLFYFDFKRRGTGLDIPSAGQRCVRWCPGRVVQKAWKTFGFPPFDWLAGKFDLYHFPNFVRPPLSQGKSVVTIHDVSFMRHPETTESKNLSYLRSQIANTVARADAIITDSFFSKGEIEQLLGVDPDRVFAVHLGLDSDRHEVDAESRQAMRSRYGLERPYVLSVGTLEPRKNYNHLIDVFERLKGFDVDLVIAGMLGWKYEPILARVKSSSIKERIRVLEFVDERHLQSLYADAHLFAIGSLYEGFGFTPLEAMQHGIPVLSSAGGSLPEVLGDAAYIVEGFDVGEWADAMEKLIAETDVRQRMIDKGRAQVQRFKWSKTASETLDVYEKICGEGGG